MQFVVCQDGLSDTESVVDTDMDSVSLSSVVTSSESSTRLDVSSAAAAAAAAAGVQHVETAEPHVPVV